MKCPFCGSDNYNFVEVVDFDEYVTILQFKCLGKCSKDFFGIYSFETFEDEDGNEVGKYEE